MSYRLADGSCSTDYKIGDKFAHHEDREIFILALDNEGICPWFINSNEGLESISWRFLTPIKAKNHACVINQLHETIRQLKATIKELER
jgi:hypothetical protein